MRKHNDVFLGNGNHLVEYHVITYNIELAYA